LYISKSTVETLVVGCGPRMMLMEKKELLFTLAFL
jgi:hypothetical protein